jgi:cytochrome c oxidase assembly factor CtaG
MRTMTAAGLMLSPALVRAHGGDGGEAVLGVPAAAALFTAAVLYGRAMRRGAPLRPRHSAAFLAGWLVVAVALLPPLARSAAQSFALHMVQHELLIVVAPPLLILGRPFAALSATLPATALRIVAWPMRLSPLAAYGVHAAALWIWHVPPLFDAAHERSALHALQHASFFVSALLFWWTVLRRVRTGTAVLYLLTTLIHSGALAALLTFAPAPLYRHTPLVEQQLGGLIMWVPAGYALLLAGLLAFDRLLERHP